MPQGVHGRLDRWSPGGIVTLRRRCPLPGARLRRRPLPLAVRRDPGPEHATRARFIHAAGSSESPASDRDVAVPARSRATPTPQHVYRARPGLAAGGADADRAGASLSTFDRVRATLATRQGSLVPRPARTPRRPQCGPGSREPSAGWRPRRSGRSPRRRGCPSSGSSYVDADDDVDDRVDAHTESPETPVEAERPVVAAHEVPVVGPVVQPDAGPAARPAG